MLLRSVMIVIVFVASLRGATAEPLLYEIRDADSRVWLLGSVHALRAGDYPLDARIESAYADAEHVVLEVHPDELQPDHLSNLMLTLGRLPAGQQLSALFDVAQRDALRAGMKAAGLPLAQYETFEPWFVALQVFGLNLARNGFAGADGVDAHYAKRAFQDGKMLGGLETAREQIALFDALPDDAQRAFLLDTLDDSANFRNDMERLIDLWRRGDAAALERMLHEEFAGEPALRAAMLDARNRRWVHTIEDYLDKRDDALVIVGALHLVGEAGVVNLLRREGLDVVAVDNQATRSADGQM